MPGLKERASLRPVLAKMPQLTAASMQMEKARMGDLQPKMMALMQDYQAQMKAASN